MNYDYYYFSLPRSSKKHYQNPIPKSGPELVTLNNKINEEPINKNGHTTYSTCKQILNLLTEQVSYQ